MTDVVHTYRLPFTATHTLALATFVVTHGGLVCSLTQTLREHPAPYGESDVEYLAEVLGDWPLHTRLIAEFTWVDTCCDPNDLRDCDERRTCPDAGRPGHSGCGYCPTHDAPIHRCAAQHFRS